MPLQERNLKQHDAEQAATSSPPPPPATRSQEAIVYIPDETSFIEHNGVKFYNTTAALIPACSNFYLVTKGKAATIKPVSGWLWETKCSFGNASTCTHGKLIGDDLPTPATRFLHETPLDDLKTWLYDPHTLDGDRTARTKTLLQHPKFGDKDLQSIMCLALREIMDAHVDIESLMEYAAREPYMLAIGDPAPQANLDYFDMRPEDFEGAPRWGLEGDVFEAALEVDYLREVVEWLKGQIRKARGVEG